MVNILDFIKECKVFFLLTLDGELPTGRPFGAIIEDEGNLFIATSDTKRVYAQLKLCPHIQIIALKNGTRNWIRISGDANECYDNIIKQKMLARCPILTKHFSTSNDQHYSVFKIKIQHTEYYDN